MKRPALAWLALVIPLWIVLVLGTHWEPIMRDGWGHWMFHRNVHLSFGSLYEFAKGSYLHNNPRIGQVLTLLVYTPGPYHSIVTPLVELGVFYLLTALVLGRWPSVRRGDDALLAATIVAISLVCIRSLGPMLFYRPFTGNYVFGFALNLLWLVPYRFGIAARASWWLAPLLLLLGAAAGLSNEHTAGAFALAAVLCIVGMFRRGQKVVPWAYAGLVGFLAGFVALLKAPGQDFRYNGLATHQTLLGRIGERGVHGNGKILVLIVIYMLPALCWIILAATNRFRTDKSEREQRMAEWMLAVTAVVVVVTLLASPKQGDRLYFAPICLCAAAIAGWVVSSLAAVQRKIAGIGAALVIAVVSVKLVLVYHRAGAEFRDRMATIEAGAPGAVVTVPTYSQTRSRWILGDDFTTDWLRMNIAMQFKLGGIELRQRDETTVPGAGPDEP